MNIHTLDEADTAYEAIQSGARQFFGDNTEHHVTIERQIMPSPSGELFFGARRDETFGDIFLLGAGGIFLSILDDATVHIGDWDHDTILASLRELRIFAALDGYRGQRPIDLPLLAQMISRLSTLFREHTEISEIDVNPILFEQGRPVVVDAKFYAV